MCQDPPGGAGGAARGTVGGLPCPLCCQGGRARGSPLLGASLVPPLRCGARGAARGPPRCCVWGGHRAGAPRGAPSTSRNKGLQRGCACWLRSGVGRGSREGNAVDGARAVWGDAGGCGQVAAVTLARCHSTAATQAGATGPWPWSPPTISHLSEPQDRGCVLLPPISHPSCLERGQVTPAVSQSPSCPVPPPKPPVPPREPKDRKSVV